MFLVREGCLLCESQGLWTGSTRRKSTEGRRERGTRDASLCRLHPGEHRVCLTISVAEIDLEFKH
jgi:hypothetical protein